MVLERGEECSAWAWRAASAGRSEKRDEDAARNETQAVVAMKADEGPACAKRVELARCHWAWQRVRQWVAAEMQACFFGTEQLALQHYYG